MNAFSHHMLELLGGLYGRPGSLGSLRALSEILGTAHPSLNLESVGLGAVTPTITHLPPLRLASPTAFDTGRLPAAIRHLHTVLSTFEYSVATGAGCPFGPALRDLHTAVPGRFMCWADRKETAALIDDLVVGLQQAFMALGVARVSVTRQVDQAFESARCAVAEVQGFDPDDDPLHTTLVYTVSGHTSDVGGLVRRIANQIDEQVRRPRADVLIAEKRPGLDRVLSGLIGIARGTPLYHTLELPYGTIQPPPDLDALKELLENLAERLRTTVYGQIATQLTARLTQFPNTIAAYRQAGLGAFLRLLVTDLEADLGREAVAVNFVTTVRIVRRMPEMLNAIDRWHEPEDPHTTHVLILEVGGRKRDVGVIVREVERIMHRSGREAVVALCGKHGYDFVDQGPGAYAYLRRPAGAGDVLPDCASTG